MQVPGGGCLPGVPGFLRCSDSPRGFAAAELRPKETGDLLHAALYGILAGSLRALRAVRFEWDITWESWVALVKFAA